PCRISTPKSTHTQQRSAPYTTNISIEYAYFLKFPLICSNLRNLWLSKKSFRREHRLRFTNARDTMLPALVSAEDFDLDPQEINRHLHFRFRQTRHPHRVFLGGHNHSQVATATTLDKADQFRPGEIVMIHAPLEEIHSNAQ